MGVGGITMEFLESWVILWGVGVGWGWMFSGTAHVHQLPACISYNYNIFIF